MVLWSRQPEPLNLRITQFLKHISLKLLASWSNVIVLAECFLETYSFYAIGRPIPKAALRIKNVVKERHFRIMFNATGFAYFFFNLR